jgi:hypothetical protein
MGLAGALLHRNAFCFDATPYVSLIPLEVHIGKDLWSYPNLEGFPEELSAIYRVKVEVVEPYSITSGNDASEVLHAVREAGYGHALALTRAPIKVKLSEEDIKKRIAEGGTELEGWRIGVSGLAESPGTAAVVTDYWRGRGVPKDIAHNRLLEVMVHELGHNFGADDCDDRGCNMHSNPTAKVRRLDAPIGVYCERHYDFLRDWLRIV